MSSTTIDQNVPYRVRSGDTLSSIAKKSGFSVNELRRLNGIANPNKIEVGQVLSLTEASAFGVSVAFLDALRHPINNLDYRIILDGRAHTGTTGEHGLTPRLISIDAKSMVEVWIKNADQQWQRLYQTVSGHGHKLITLVSDALVIKSRTEPHPSSAPAVQNLAKPRTATPDQQANPPAIPKGSPSNNNPAVKVKKSKGPQGQPVISIGVDIPKDLLNYFGRYVGGEIAELDWDSTAKFLECDENVLRAFADVESGGRSSFWRLNSGQGAHIPAILFERHYFSQLTKGVYDKDYPDVAWPTGYRTRERLGQHDKKMHDGNIDANDIYSDYASSYLRLIRAYRLDPIAALKSCSWGKFQIMGENWRLCRAVDMDDFVFRICTSEPTQLKLLAAFIRHKPLAWKNSKNKALGKEISLWDAVKTKNWRAIAFNYNGPAYEKYSYHTKLEQAYEKHRRTS